MSYQRRKHLTTQNSKIIFDIECDGLKPTKLHCIVAKELNGTLYKFTPDKIKEGLDFLSNADTLIGHNILRFDLDVIKKLTGVDLYHKNIEDTIELYEILIDKIKEKALVKNIIRMKKQMEFYEFYE